MLRRQPPYLPNKGYCLSFCSNRFLLFNSVILLFFLCSYRLGSIKLFYFKLELSIHFLCVVFFFSSLFSMVGCLSISGHISEDATRESPPGLLLVHTAYPPGPGSATSSPRILPLQHLFGSLAILAVFSSPLSRGLFILSSFETMRLICSDSCVKVGLH